ncbi:MAG: MXAN_5187 C-terminal domain-containing protein [Bradymonadaceae bacterium]
MALPENLNSSEIDALLNELEKRLNNLRVRYEQYFMGVDRMPPEQPRKDVVRMFFDLEQAFIRNTAQKFRLRSLVQRFNTYKNYWNRITRQIEEGTFKRDMNRAQRNQDRREAREERSTAFEIDLDMDLIEDLSVIEREFDEMNVRGEAKPAVSKPAVSKPAVSKPAAQPEISAEEKERIKQARLREIQAKLMGMGDDVAPPPASAPATGDERRSKLDEMRRRLQGRDSGPDNPSESSVTFKRDGDGNTRRVENEVPGMPTGGADYEKLRKIRQMKEKMLRQKESGVSRAVQRPGSSKPVAAAAEAEPSIRSTGSQRVIQRRTTTNDDDPTRRIYDSLVEAKRRCNESTANLSYDAVKKSMDKQREQLKRSKGARDVDFKVVIKEGKAYLKPEAKDS